MIGMEEWEMRAEMTTGEATIDYRASASGGEMEGKGVPWIAIS